MPKLKLKLKDNGRNHVDIVVPPSAAHTVIQVRTPLGTLRDAAHYAPDGTPVAIEMFFEAPRTVEITRSDAGRKEPRQR